MIPKVLAQGNGDPIIQAAAIIMLAAACEKGKAAVQRGVENKCTRAEIGECVECMKQRVFELAGEIIDQPLKEAACENCKYSHKVSSTCMLSSINMTTCLNNNYRFFKPRPEVTK